MNVTMAELNKNVNSIINRAHASGETVTILKHGKPIATILPVTDQSPIDDALRYLMTYEPVSVTESITSVIALGRHHGV
jgi:prevent-host-death family protein